MEDKLHYILEHMGTLQEAARTFLYKANLKGTYDELVPEVVS